MSSTKTQNQYKAIIDDLDVSSFDNDEIEMPIKHDFKYDDFQKRSMKRLYQKKCVFVSTPTSSGKTVVASYAIGLSLSHKKRAIYTSPIKSLSNQKFEEFSRDFGKVGILTGDTNINRNAPVLIMTTEILRSMLYKNDPLLNNVEIVIFDEFHYLAHEQRGGVWEESVIRMPNHINMVFLSASMPNAEDISKWISKTKQRDVYIEKHNIRPVPLNHCIYINNQFYTISRNGQTFDENQLKRAKIHRAPKKCELKSSSYLVSFILNLRSNDLLPALMFEFSINNIEIKADTLLSCTGINLINNKEKSEIEKFLTEKVLKRISDEDQKLFQVQKMIKLLKVGIGIHHSGILPILKETVEILLNKGLLKLVFCTSTIGMGLNLPVRTCCFTNLQKFNGSDFVDLTLTEYQQMSGRAGRRGKDDVGTSVICIGGRFPDNYYLRGLFCGEPEEIKSQFQISFKMVINSFCEEKGMKIHDILRKSFYENSSDANLSKLNQEIEKNKDMIVKMNSINQCTHFVEDDIEDTQFNYPIYSFAENYEKITKLNEQIVNKYQKEFEKILDKGVIVLYMDRTFCMIAIIDHIIYSENDDGSDEIDEIFLLSSKGEMNITNKYFPYLHILALPIEENMNTMSKENMIMILNQYNPKERLDKYEDFMQIEDDEFLELSNVHHKCILDIINSPCMTCESLKNHFKTAMSINNLKNKIKHSEKILTEIERREYGKYLKMLKDKRYITEENGKYISTEKGNIANDIYGHEIISTELFYKNIFNKCSPEEIAALCSCFVAQRIGSKNDYIESISPKMDEKVYKMYEMIREIISNMKQNQIPFEDDFLALNMNQHMMYPVYMWANGRSFKDIMKHSGKVLEGQMASVITKVYSMLTNFHEVAESMEEKELASKIGEAIKKIQRGVVFSKSLYLYLD